MPQNLICRHTVGAVAAQPDREARGPALGTRGKCPGAARELRGTRKRHTGKNGILPSGVATYNDSAVASSGVSGTIVSHRGRSGRGARWRRAVRVAHVFGTCETAAWAHVRLHVIGGRYAASSQGLRGSVLAFWLCCLRRSAPRSGRIVAVINLAPHARRRAHRRAHVVQPRVEVLAHRRDAPTGMRS